jgi:hypothetical protein
MQSTNKPDGCVVIVASDPIDEDEHEPLSVFDWPHYFVATWTAGLVMADALWQSGWHPMDYKLWGRLK